jgi:hypothetical protein
VYMCVIYFTTLSVFIPAFTWRAWGEPQETSVKVPSFPAEIRTEPLPNTDLERYRYISLLDDCGNVVRTDGHQPVYESSASRIEISVLIHSVNGLFLSLQ